MILHISATILTLYHATNEFVFFQVLRQKNESNSSSIL